MRTAKYSRKTNETEISCWVDLDGTGKAEINTSIKFLNHLLTSLSFHSLIDIKIEAKGDLKHHIVEDTSIVLGEALVQALNKDQRIIRFADATIPMDESLVRCCIDLGGRSYSKIMLDLINPMTEDMANEDIVHFLSSLAANLSANIHIQTVYGENDHHKAEAAFKALALCLRSAVTIDPRRVDKPSSKGRL